MALGLKQESTSCQSGPPPVIAADVLRKRATVQSPPF